MWNRYDADNDGSLSKEEASKISGFNFQDADVNKDGKISEFEFSAVQSSMPAKGDSGK